MRVGMVGEERKEGTLVLVRTLRSLRRSYICNLTVILPTFSSSTLHRSDSREGPI